jgi:hypothetical protein
MLIDNSLLDPLTGLEKIKFRSFLYLKNETKFFF